MPIEISEKEFAVIKEISNNHLPDQRTIATKTGLSLGLTNLIIKKLIKTGYIKIKQLNRRKIQYILTPKGFAEKAKKSYRYTIKTINLFKSIKEQIQKLILDYKNQGIQKFIILGKNELADIAEIAIKPLSDKYNIIYTRLEQTKNNITSKDNGYLIILTDNTKIKNNTKNKIDLIKYLAYTGIFL